MSTVLHAHAVVDIHTHKALSTTTTTRHLTPRVPFRFVCGSGRTSAGGHDGCNGGFSGAKRRRELVSVSQSPWLMHCTTVPSPGLGVNEEFYVPRQQRLEAASSSSALDVFSLRPQLLGVVRTAWPRITGPSLSLAVLGGGSEAVDSSVLTFLEKKEEEEEARMDRYRGQDPRSRRSQCRGLGGLATMGGQSSLLGRKEEAKKEEDEAAEGFLLSFFLSVGAKKMGGTFFGWVWWRRSSTCLRRSSGQCIVEVWHGYGGAVLRCDEIPAFRVDSESWKSWRGSGGPFFSGCLSYKNNLWKFVHIPHERVFCIAGQIVVYEHYRSWGKSGGDTVCAYLRGADRGTLGHRLWRNVEVSQLASWSRLWPFQCHRSCEFWSDAVFVA